MSQGGFFAVSREIFDHPVVGPEKPYSRFEAWLWLVSAAAYLPRRVSVKNGQTRSVVTLQRGQATFARSFLAEAWGWTEKRVRTFLKQLERERQIDLQTGRQQTLITICNYELYQMPIRQQGRQKGQHQGPHWAGNGPEEEQRNKETNKNARTWAAEPEGFAEFYDTYPRKAARTAAVRAYLKVVPKQISAEALLERTKQFAREWVKRPRQELKFCPHPATWLNGGRFMDDPAEASPDGAESPANHLPLRRPDEFTNEDWMDALELHRDGQCWPEQEWGPPPGQSGCRVPYEVLSKFEHMSGAGATVTAPRRDRVA